MDRLQSSLWSQSPILKKCEVATKSCEQIPSKPGGQKKLTKDSRAEKVAKTNELKVAKSNEKKKKKKVAKTNEEKYAKTMEQKDVESAHGEQHKPQQQLVKDKPQQQLVKDKPQQQLVKDKPQQQLVEDKPQQQLVKDKPQKQLVMDKPQKLVKRGTEKFANKRTGKVVKKRHAKKSMTWKCVHSRAYHTHMVEADIMGIDKLEAKASFKLKLPMLKKQFADGLVDF